MRRESRLLAAAFGILLIAGGCGSTQSVQPLVSLQAPATVLNVAAFPGNQAVRITWSGVTNNPSIVGYNIYRSTASQDGFTLVGSTGLSPNFWEDLGPDLNGDGLPDGLVTTSTTSTR